jgi:GTPase
VDICPENILKTTRTALAKLLRSHGKMPFPVKDMAAVQVAADSIASDRITPVFTLSSVSGQGKRQTLGMRIVALTLTPFLYVTGISLPASCS